MMTSATETLASKARTGDEVRPPMRDRATEILNAVREMGTDAKKMAQEQVAKIRGSATDYLQQGRAKAENLEKSVEDGIRQKPLRSVLIAAGIGLVLGIFLRRRS